MSEECSVCGEPLEYLERGEEMQCSICGRKSVSRASCAAGHFVCDACHASGTDKTVRICLTADSKDPGQILERLMSEDECHMHGPEHHVLVGAALLTAYANAGGNIDLPGALAEMVARGRQVPGGACGFWGACGAGISTGIFVAIVTGSTPLAAEPFALSNLMTSEALRAIGEVGGPRCCKRDSYLSVCAAVEFTRRHLGVDMKTPKFACTRSRHNTQCIGSRCPFAPGMPDPSEPPKQAS